MVSLWFLSSRRFNAVDTPSAMPAAPLARGSRLLLSVLKIERSPSSITKVSPTLSNVLSTPGASIEPALPAFLSHDDLSRG